MADDIVGLAYQLFGSVAGDLGEVVVGVGDDPFGIGITLDIDIVFFSSISSSIGWGRFI